MFTGLRFGWLWLSKPFWDPIFWGVFGAPPVLEPILVGIEPDVHWGSDLDLDPWPILKALGLPYVARTRYFDRSW